MRSAIELARKGQVAEAEAALREAVRLDPAFPQAHHNLGVALAEQGRAQEAVDSFEEALRLFPQYVEAHLNLANTLSTLNRREEALGHYRRALELRPDSADALNGLGLTLTEMQRWAEAAVYLRQAVRLRPEFAEAHNSLGLALAEQAKWREAEAAYEQAMRLDPRYAEALTNLGSCYAHRGRLAEALAQYDLALWLRPDSVSTRWNRSLSLLQSGDLEQGFREYEWRWRRNKSPMRQLPRPMWDGSGLEGRDILLWCEQGLGDALQFVRYVTLVKEKCARQVILECPQPLLKVLANFPGVDQLVPEGQPLPTFDVHAPLMSLPRLFGTTLQTVPAMPSYLSPDPQRVKRWKQRLREDDGLKVGVAWQGNPHHQWDRYRSAPLAALAPLARVPRVKLYSLQRGPGREQIEENQRRVPVVELLDAVLPESEAWTEKAALVACLDLVVTVDTATAHLAGALGVRTWVALASLCDWRWLLGRTDNPWYPTLRLFRQKELGQWDVVFRHMAAGMVRLSAAAPHGA